LWAALRAQWAMLLDGVDAGDLQIPGFDGGLFDPAKCPILDDPALVIGDTYVRDLVDALCWTQPALSVNHRDQVARRRVNYRELGVEQLGSIYEGLLAFEPQIAAVPMSLARLGGGQSAIIQVTEASQVPDGAEVLESYEPGTFYLFEATGQRKGSGSYYTPRQLAHFVVGETLRPLTETATPQQILSLRIIDPAMGSGGFLVPAVHWLTEAYGEALARAGEDIDHKLDDQERAAYRRLIVERCIYGIDLNPMAVELAKVSLWLATAAAGKPLSFLDAHLRCGNALVGATFSAWESIPPVIRGTRDSGSDQSPGMATLFDLPAPDLGAVIATRKYLAVAPSDDRLQVRAKERDFARMVEGDDFRRLRELGDWWITPFYSEDFRKDAATWRRARSLIENGRPFAESGIAALFEQTRRYIRDEIRPFHWETEFPEVFFNERGERRDDAGFDAIVGNPPWEGITFKAKEFYGRFDPSYAFLKTKDDKIERQDELKGRTAVADARVEEDRRLNGVKNFIKGSGQYKLLYSHGTTFNYYRAFLEQALTLVAEGGRLGFIIDSGVVSDAATAEHRRELLDHCTVDQFVLCDNKNKIFPIDTREQFLILVAERGGTTDPLPFTSGVSRLEDLLDLGGRTLPIFQRTLKALAPETLAVPDTRDSALLELMAVIYADHPFLLSPMPAGGWRIDWGREFHIDQDRISFSEAGTGAPLREGKHIHQFRSDFAEPTYHLNVPEGERALLGRAMKRAKLKGDPYSRRRRRGETPLLEPGIRLAGLESPFDQYRPGFRETARAGDERSLIAAILPPGTSLAHTVHYFYRSEWNQALDGYETILPASAMAYIVGVFNSLVLDFVVRRKVGMHVTKSVMSTLPVVDVPLDAGPGAEIIRLSARLSCQGAEFAELAGVLGCEYGPLGVDDERAMRAELDARVALLYGLSAPQLELVMADFRQSADSEGSPVRPDDDYKDLVRREYGRLIDAGGDPPAA
jgi:N-6 DNA Methylase